MHIKLEDRVMVGTGKELGGRDWWILLKTRIYEISKNWNNSTTK